ncbi:UDP-glucose/GDP-mannose dehydrogenase family protein [Pseudactinotalea sp. HY158]|uniref:UDP-glucose dehydrogenase family protein n=1 Tax=Pseudactinotalea sp. HY158 TaxID=2654547 RepID=UPI00129C560C|nr:UDP-glucose/GDP-mannose dehydrogenase family protein [Pseudactinotalea sp. HY158]QGH68508.1 nucleotide sugar dehydrogenase [Pseudactinotalea sp. HY158]
MRVAVVGCGYLGAVHAAAMAEFGHDVIGFDVDARKIAALRAGEPPIFEPGLPELLSAGISSGRLNFSSDVADIAGASLIFLTVGTPQLKDGRAADLSYVDAAITALAGQLRPGDVVVGKSTVPIGTAARLAARLDDLAPGAVLAWNPEFLREGWAVQDSLAPNRLVFGLPPAADRARRAEAALREVFARPLANDTPLIVTDYATAELVKVSANAFLATKISFINAMAEIAEVTGADVTQLADAIGYDDRIGRRYLGAGVGFGGGCLPKDIRAFRARAEELGRGESVAFLAQVDAINLRRRKRLVAHAIDLLDGTPHGKVVAVLGLAFKPQSDDVRDSPALDIAVRLHGLGAVVRATDPKAIENSRALHPQLDYRESFEDAVTGADVLVLVTEWDEYRYLDPEAVGELVAGRNVADGRNSYDPARWRAAGWRYRGLGRP